jgi:hypothetical protein
MQETREELQLAERTCIVTRRVMPPEQLLRFARAPDGQVVPDLKRNLPGRGVWVSLSRAAVAEAVARKTFSRAFGEASSAAPELPEQVAGLLRRQALGLVSLAKKAGQAVAGFDKVEEMARRDEAGILLHAREAAADGRRKIDRLASPGTEIVNFFGVNELDLAFGRSNVIHAAVRKGPLAAQLALAVQRNRMYEAEPEPPNVE